MFFSFFLVIDPYSHLRHWLPFFPYQTKELKHSIKQFRLQFQGRSATVCFGLQVQNTPPLLFSMYTPTPAAAGTRPPTTLHATVLFHSVAARQVPPKRRFFLLFFFFCSRDNYIPVDAPQRNASYVC